MAKKKEKGLNKKLLSKMTASAMPEPMEKERPMMHLTGKEAKGVHSMKPGSMVKMTVKGKVMSVGMRRWGPDRGAPEAEVEIHGVQMHGKGGKVMGGKEMMEDEEK